MDSSTTAAQRLTRRRVAIGAAAFAGGLALSGGVSALLLNSERSASLTMLGSGSGMSVLVSSGRSRLLFLNGSDPADFGNALRRAQTPLLKRVDIVIVANELAGATFVRASLDQIDYEHLYVIGDERNLLDAGIVVEKSVADKMSVELPGALSIDLNVRRDAETGDASWIAHLTQEQRCAAVAWGDPAQTIELISGKLGAWVQLDGSIPESERLRSIGPASISLPASSMSGRDFADAFPDDDTWQPERRRIHAGEATHLRMHDLPENGAQDSTGNPQSGQ